MRWDLLGISVFMGIPIWLVIRAWRRYFSLESTLTKNAPLTLAALGLLSLGSGISLVFYAFVNLGGNTKTAKEILSLVPSLPVMVSINICTCLCSFILSQFISNKVQTVLPLKKAITLASIYIALMGCLL